MGEMARLVGEGKASVVQGVGYPDPNLSHFDSMATWMYGNAVPSSIPTTGWVGRWVGPLSPGPSSSAPTGSNFAFNRAASSSACATPKGIE